MSNRISIITEHKIGNTTYSVVAASSDRAAERIDKKIEKLILKDMRQSMERRPSREYTGFSEKKA